MVELGSSAEPKWGRKLRRDEGNPSVSLKEVGAVTYELSKSCDSECKGWFCTCSAPNEKEGR